MRRRAVTIVGAGSLRCAPAVLASIAAKRFERPLEVRLFDANGERLDLMARLALRLFEITNAAHDVLRRPVLEEALFESDAVVVCLYEDCAKRMTGKTAARFLLPSDPVDPTTRAELNRGDINRPTPFDELSPMTLEALSTPEDPRTRDQAVADAMAVVAGLVGKSLVLNLTRGIELPAPVSGTELVWPAPLAAEEHASFPHRILRWVNGDHEAFDYLTRFEQSPVAEWLVNDFGAM